MQQIYRHNHHPMENNSTGPVALIMSLVWSGIAWVGLIDAKTWLTIVASLIGIVSGIMAARHYYYSGEEKRLLIRKMKEGK